MTPGSLVKFLDRRTWRFGRVVSVVRRGQAKGAVRVQFFKFGLKTANVEPRNVVDLRLTQKNPISSQPFARMGNWMLWSETRVYDPVTKRQTAGYWAKSADTGHSGFLAPMGKYFEFHEQLDFFAPRSGILQVPSEKIIPLDQHVRGSRRANPAVLTGAVRTTPRGPAIRTFEGKKGSRHAVDIALPAAIARLPDWRAELAQKPRRLSQPLAQSSSSPKTPPLGCRPSPLAHCDSRGNPLGRAALADGKSIEYAWHFVPLSELITSHDPWSLAPAKNFPAELQPRDRSRASYQDQVTRLVAHFDPALLFWSPNAADGAPIVGQDGIVESGNGRVMMLKRVFRQYPDKWKNYQILARDWCNELGVKWGKLLDGVLIRVRLSKVNRADFARAANIAGQQQMAAAEQALADAAQFSLEILAKYQPESGLGTAANASFVNAFVQHVAGPQSRGDIVDAHGKLSQSGEDRIRFALFARAYGLQAEPLIQSLTEDRESDLRTVLNGMRDVAPQWAAFRAAIDSGHYARRYDLNSAIVDMAFLVRRAKDMGMGIDQMRGQMDFANPVAREVDLLALAAHPKGSRASAKSLAAAIFGFMDRVAKQGPLEQIGMFASEPAPALDFLRRAVNDVLLSADVPSAAQAAAMAHRMADPDAVKLWPAAWRAALGKTANPAPRGHSLAILPIGHTYRIQGHRVRNLGGGFVAIDGTRFHI